MTEKAYPLYSDAIIETSASLSSADGSYAEAVLYNMLREQLPPEWALIWGVQLGAHEYDFLVMAPGIGIVNVECKGHGYSFEGATNKFTWTNKKTGAREHRDLLGQAAKARRYYIDYIRNSLFGHGAQWGVMGYCVVFPIDEFLGINLKGLPIYRASDCDPAQKGLTKIILEALEMAKGKLRECGIRSPSLLTNANAEKIWNLWCQTETHNNDNISFVRIDLADYRHQMDNLLTVAQENILKKILAPSTRHMLIEGVAGTGKTYLAIASAMAIQGRVLLVCFNKVLSRYISLISPNKPGLDISHFHKLGEILLKQGLTHPQRQDESDEEYWGAVDHAFLDAARRLSPGTYPLYDAILVDEAQDLTKTQLRFLLRFRRAGGKLILFADREQVLYPHRLTESDLRLFCKDLEVEQLSINLRNTIEISKYCTQFINEDSFSKALLIGPKVSLIEVSRAKINEFLRCEILTRYNSCDVAVISPFKYLIDEVGIASGVPFYGPDEHHLRRTEKNLKAWKENRCAWKSTTQAFKGLEAMAVVHLLPFGYDLNSIKYVGGSRASYQLFVVVVKD